MSFKILVVPDLDEIPQSNWAQFEWHGRRFTASSTPASWARQLAANMAVRQTPDRVVFQSYPLDLAVEAVKERREALSADFDLFADELAAQREEVDAAIEAIEDIDTALKADGILARIEGYAHQVKIANGIRA